MEQAKQARSIYWHVPLTENKPQVSSSVQTRQQRLERDTESTEPEITSLEQSQAHQPLPMAAMPQTFQETTTIQATGLLNTDNGHLLDQNSPQQINLPSDTETEVTEGFLSPVQELEEMQFQPSTFLAEELERRPTEQEAEAWLDGIDDEWLNNLNEAEPAVQTSPVTDNHTVAGKLYKDANARHTKTSTVPGQQAMPTSRSLIV